MYATSSFHSASERRYLGELGLDYDAITWIVEPKPKEMHKRPY
jgi:hypothetical protein